LFRSGVTPSERDLVLAAAQDYDWESVRPFVESLRATTYAGEIRFFAPGASADTERKLREHGVAVDRPHRVRLKLGVHVLRPYNPKTTRVRWHVQPLYRHLVRALALPARDRRAATARLAGALANVEVARYFWFWNYLRRNVARYRNVMLTDVRDVLFLGDPFDFDIGEAVCSFEEDAHVTIGTQTNNRGWLHGAYGQEALDELADRRIVCSGITIGAAPAVLDYLTVMVDELARLARQYKGMDQGVHNYVLHKGLVPRARLVSNADGPVLTVGGMRAPEAVAALRERAPELRVVHQYDRHPQVAEAIASLASVPLA
jgi:hypothetical protein